MRLKSYNPKGAGWTPVFSIVPDGERRVQQVTDWTGGSGAKPAVGVYVSANGYTSNIALATDVRGASAGTFKTNEVHNIRTNEAYTGAMVLFNLQGAGGTLQMQGSPLFTWESGLSTLYGVPNGSIVVTGNGGTNGAPFDITLEFSGDAVKGSTKNLVTTAVPGVVITRVFTGGKNMESEVANQIRSIPLATPLSAAYNESQSLVFASADVNQFFALRATATTQAFQFRLTDYATDTALFAALSAGISGLTAYTGRTISISGTLNGTTTKSGILTLNFDGYKDVPLVEVTRGAVRKYLVENGDSGLYSFDAGANFSLPITEANFQSNLRNVPQGEIHLLKGTGALVNATIYNTVSVAPGEAASSIQTKVRALGGVYANVTISGSTTPIPGNVGLTSKGATWTHPTVNAAILGNGTAETGSTSLGVIGGQAGQDWMQVDVGYSTAVGEFKIFKTVGGGTNDPNSRIRVYGSSIGTFTGEETLLGAKENAANTGTGAWADNTYESIFITNAPTFRYYRFKHEAATANVAYFSEIQVNTTTGGNGFYTLVFPVNVGDVTDITATPGTGWSTSVLAADNGAHSGVIAVGNSTVNAEIHTLSTLATTGATANASIYGSISVVIGENASNIQTRVRALGGSYATVVVGGSTKASGYSVTGGGTTYHNGSDYYEGGTFNGLPYFQANHSGQAVYLFARTVTGSAAYGSAGWALNSSLADGGNNYQTPVAGTLPPATGWVIGTGASPVPAVAGQRYTEGAYTFTFTVDAGNVTNITTTPGTGWSTSVTPFASTSVSASFTGYYPVAANPASSIVSGKGASVVVLELTGLSSQIQAYVNREGTPLTVGNDGLMSRQDKAELLRVSNLPVASASSAAYNEVQTLTFTNADVNQFFAVRALGTSSVFQFRFVDYATDAAFLSALANGITGLASYSGRTVSISGSLTGTTAKSGMLTLTFDGYTNVPSLEVVRGAVRRVVVENGDFGNYSSDSGASFLLGITQATFQINQRLVSPGVISVGSSTAPGLPTTITVTGATEADVNGVYTRGPNIDNGPGYTNSFGSQIFNGTTNGNLWIVTRSGVGAILRTDGPKTTFTSTGWAVTNNYAGAVPIFLPTGGLGLASFTNYFPVSSTPAAPVVTGTGASALVVELTGIASQIVSALTREGSPLTAGNNGLMSKEDKAELLRFSNTPLAAASSTPTNEVQILTFTNVDVNQFFGLRAAATSPVFQFRIADYASDALFTAALAAGIAGLSSYTGRTVSISGALTGTTTKSGTLTLTFDGFFDVPLLEAVRGTTRKYLVEIGNTGLYSFDNGAAFNLGITQTAFQANQRAIPQGEIHSLKTVGATVNATIYGTVSVAPGEAAASIQTKVRALGGIYANVTVVVTDGSVGGKLTITGTGPAVGEYGTVGVYQSLPSYTADDGRSIKGIADGGGTPLWVVLGTSQGYAKAPRTGATANFPPAGTWVGDNGFPDVTSSGVVYNTTYSISFPANVGDVPDITSAPGTGWITTVFTADNGAHSGVISIGSSVAPQSIDAALQKGATTAIPFPGSLVPDGGDAPVGDPKWEVRNSSSSAIAYHYPGIQEYNQGWGVTVSSGRTFNVIIPSGTSDGTYSARITVQAPAGTYTSYSANFTVQAGASVQASTIIGALNFTSYFPIAAIPATPVSSGLGSSAAVVNLAGIASQLVPALIREGSPLSTGNNGYMSKEDKIRLNTLDLKLNAPSVTTPQRDVLVPAINDVVKNTTSGQLEVWDGAQWVGIWADRRETSLVVAAANEGWTDSGVLLTGTDAVSIFASGIIDFNVNVAHSFPGPNGYESTNYNGLRDYSLVGVVLPEGVFPSGATAGSFNVGEIKGVKNLTGRLWLRMNDTIGAYADNSGQFNVKLWSYLRTPSTFRNNVSLTTGSLANNSVTNIDLCVGRVSHLLQCSTSVPAEIRIYATFAARAADVSRASTTSPPAGTGLLYQATTASGALAVPSSRAVTLFNLDSNPNSWVYASVKNLSGSAAPVTLTLTKLTLEN